VLNDCAINGWREPLGGAVFFRPNGNQDYAVLTNPFRPTGLTPSYQVLDVNTSFLTWLFL
jgi:hypothetical protein